MDNASTDRLRLARSSLAQTLPDDVLCELYKTVAVSDPPLRKGPPGSDPSDWPNRPVRREDEPVGRIAPSWSTDIIERYANEKDAKASLSFTQGQFAKRASLGWIRLTHVSTHWRAVGLSMALLWGNVFSVFPQAAETVLARIRDAPICLDMDLIERVELQGWLASPPLRAFFKLAAQHLAQARIITFPRRAGPYWDPSLLRDIHLPYLEILHVNHVQDTSVIDFILQAPRLAHLVLDVFIPSWVTPSLRYLKITARVGLPSATLLLDLLRTTPLLEELIMAPTTPPEAFNSTSTVPLHRLAYAHFSARPSSLRWVKYLDIPHTAKLCFTLWYQPQADGSLEPLLDDLSPRLRHSTIDHLSISPGPLVDVSFASSHSIAGDETARIFIRTSYNAILEDFNSMPNFLSQIILRMEPASIISFHANSQDSLRPVPEDDLAPQYNDILNQFTHLAAMSVSWHPSRYQIFLPPLRLGSVPATLNTLVVFSEDALVAYQSYASDAPIAITAVDGVRRRWEDILSVLHSRMSAGRQIERLILKGLRKDEEAFGKINASGLRRAAKLVGEVVDERDVVP